jgi:hypothetical protein
MPKLKKGETAPGVEARIAIARENVRRRLQIFMGLCAEDNAIDKNFIEHFVTMDALACWNEIQLGILPVSSKTLRKYINEMFPGGITVFRREAARLTKQKDLKEKVNIGISPDLISEVRRQTEREAAATLEMTARYLDLLERLKKLATYDANAEKQIRHHLRIFGEAKPHIRRVK